MATPGKVEAIDRALTLLEALADAGHDGVPLSDLAQRSGMNKSTAYRALATLRGHGFATQSPSGVYQLGPTAMALGERFWSPHSLASALHPALVAVSRAADELVHLGVWMDDHVLYIDKVEPERAIRVWSAVGQRVPVATTSLGRALLAAREVTDEHLDVYVGNLPSGRTVSVEQLRGQVQQARTDGYATELGENEPGVACLGMAVMRGPQPVAALSITSLAERMTARRRRELAAIIRREVPPLLPEGLSLMSAG